MQEQFLEAKSLHGLIVALNLSWGNLTSVNRPSDVLCGFLGTFVPLDLTDRDQRESILTRTRVGKFSGRNFLERFFRKLKFPNRFISDPRNSEIKSLRHAKFLKIFSNWKFTFF